MIAQGAEAGDNRLEKALGLLKENNIAEASTLLEAFANDKETKIAKDRKEAAAAYRNLGAIAGLPIPSARSRLTRKRSPSIRTISRACIGRATF